MHLPHPLLNQPDARQLFDLMSPYKHLDLMSPYKHRSLSLFSPFPDVMANKTRQTGNNAKQVDSDKNWRRARAIGACPNTRVVIEDVTRGKEKMKIQVVDDTGGEYASPEPFFYISNSVVYKKANLKFTLREIGSDCCGECGDDCMGDDCVCSRLTIREACPYSVGGCLTGSSLDHVLELRNPTNYNLTRNSLMHVCKEAGKKCTGRIIQPFIKECWEGCGCSMKCVNRVVQKGICRKLQVFRTSDSGWGIRALEKLPAGTFGFEYVGEVLTKSELLARIKDNSATVKYSVALDADLDSEILGDDSKLFYLGATRYSNISRFIRSSTFNEANLIDIPVAIENNHRNYYHVAFFTKVDVDPFIELTWDRRVHSSKKYKVDTAEKIDTRFSSERVVFTRKGKRSKVEGCKYI